jgi:hypothetical protein
MKYAIALLALLAVEDQANRKLPSRTKCRTLVAAKPWARGLKQIPSTVIDKGVLKHVPYTSYRAGDYELNIYGDPNAPCCFEIGVYNKLVGDAAARKNCIDIVTSLMEKSEDKKVVAALKLDADKQTRDGITFEITPPTAEDAYGGWWVSVYDEAGLDKSRASPKELEKITTTRQDVKKVDAEKKPEGAMTVDPVVEGRWGQEDLKDARNRKDVPEEQQKVYTPAYTKKDGVYVPDRTEDDTGYILFICANSDKHEDQEVLLKECQACKKDSTFFWDTSQSIFCCFKCGAPYESARIKCPACGKIPKRVRTKHK